MYNKLYKNMLIKIILIHNNVYYNLLNVKDII